VKCFLGYTSFLNFAGILKSFPSLFESNSTRILISLDQEIFYSPINHPRSIFRYSHLEYLELAEIPLACHEPASKENLSNAASLRWKGRLRLFEFPKVSWIEHVRILKISNQGENGKLSDPHQIYFRKPSNKIWSGQSWEYC
jgi:hypothetical protein